MKVDRLLAHLCALPEDVLMHISQYHTDIYLHARNAQHKSVMSELQSVLQTVRDHCYRQMDYAYLLPADSIEDELDSCVQRASNILTHVDGRDRRLYNLWLRRSHPTDTVYYESR